MKEFESGLMCDLPEIVNETVSKGDVMEAFSAYWMQAENYITAIPRKVNMVRKDTALLASNLFVADELRKIRFLLEEKTK